MALHFNEFKSSSPKHALQQLSLVEVNWPNSSEEEDENVKSLQSDGWLDNRRTIGNQKNSFELLAQVSLKQNCLPFNMEQA